MRNISSWWWWRCIRVACIPGAMRYSRKPHCAEPRRRAGSRISEPIPSPAFHGDQGRSETLTILGSLMKLPPASLAELELIRRPLDDERLARREPAVSQPSRPDADVRDPRPGLAPRPVRKRAEVLGLQCRKLPSFRLVRDALELHRLLF